ncbi:MAG: hypothetical protein WBV33_10025, partial [Terracidiphilus sp.]
VMALNNHDVAHFPIYCYLQQHKAIGSASRFLPEMPHGLPRKFDLPDHLRATGDREGRITPCRQKGSGRRF